MKTKLNLKKALSLLVNGEIVALPTETVYGLAGRIDKEKTLKKIFLLKKRPLFDPLIVHCRDREQALECLSGDTSIMEKLFKHFSPGPLTVVGEKDKNISSLITAGKKTVAVRIPKHSVIRKILKELPVPLAAPSANPYGKVSPVSAQHVLSGFNKQVPVLDGGICKKGLESTIVFPDSRKKTLFILRPGMITKQELEAFIQKNCMSWTVEYKKDSSQPGGQNSHYKPESSLYILETEKSKKKIKAFLSDKFPDKKIKELQLEKSPQKTARLLYSRLRKLSDKDKNVIFVLKTKELDKGLWPAIWDRLNKASSGLYKL